MLFFQSLLWKFSFEALLQTTQYPLPASAGIWADGFWQIVSSKEQTTFKGHRSSRWPFVWCAEDCGTLLHLSYSMTPSRLLDTTSLRSPLLGEGFKQP